MFVDRVKIMVQAGRGGDGCMSFRREKYIPRGGPDGGNGGNGGSVTLQAIEGVDSLAALSHRHHWKATNGTRGNSSNCSGANGDDLLIQVPPGTVIYDAEAGHIIKDLAVHGDSIVIARGGHGGRGNLHFKSSINRAPRDTTPGREGEERLLILELKVIADVGLIGKPNAGKSTMLSRLSRATPEIADYPFTTKFPNLGFVKVSAERSFVMADIPGLIEGAHRGAGLGHEFLRHIERAGILVHLVEPMPADGSDALDNYRVVHSELEQYDVKLGERPEIVAISKAELPGAAEVRDQLADRLGRDVLLVSAVTGQGLDKLLHAVIKALAEKPEAGVKAIIETSTEPAT